MLENSNVFDKIREWSKEKGLDKALPFVQFAKTIEETGELASVLCKQKSDDEFKDAIGDIVVTLTILCQIKGINIEECIEGAYNVIKNRKGKMSKDGVFIKEEDNNIQEKNKEQVTNQTPNNNQTLETCTKEKEIIEKTYSKEEMLRIYFPFVILDDKLVEFVTSKDENGEYYFNAEQMRMLIILSRFYIRVEEMEKYKRKDIRSSMVRFTIEVMEDIKERSKSEFRLLKMLMEIEDNSKKRNREEERISLLKEIDDFIARYKDGGETKEIKQTDVLSLIISACKYYLSGTGMIYEFLLLLKYKI